MQKLSSTRSSKIFLSNFSPALKRSLGVIAIIIFLLGIAAVCFLPDNAAQSNPSNSFSIATVVGGGFTTNVPVKQAPGVLPTAVARDPLGRGFYFIEETSNFTYLRFVNTTSSSITLAGATIQPNNVNLVAGSGSLTTDGTPARDTDLTAVTGLAVDPTGNAVYMSMPYLNAIRALNVGTQNFTVLGKTIAPGMMSTIFTPNLSDIRSLIIQPSTGDFFFIGPVGTTQAVYQLSAAGIMGIFAGGSLPEGNGDGGFATAARLTAPTAMAFDAAGNMLIAEGGDTRNNPGAIRKVNTGGIITTLSPGLAYPNGVAITPGGQIYATLGNAQQIVRIGSNGSVTRVAGNTVSLVCDLDSNPSCGDGGTALNANFSFPGSTEGRGVLIAADSNGIFVPDFNTHRVRYINLSGATVTVAGVSIGSQKIDSVAGNGFSVPFDNMNATSSELVGPTGVVADAQGNFFISDTGNVSRLRFVNRGMSPITLFANTAWAQTVQPGQIITLNQDSGQERVDDRISTIAFSSPQGLAATAQGIFIVDSQNGVLFPPGLPTPTQKRTGLIRFLNTTANDVTVLGVTVSPGMCSVVAGQPQGTPKADIIGPIDNIPATQSTIVPTDIAVDAQGILYIADQGDNKIRKVSANGLITTFYGDGSAATLNGATGIAFDSTGRLHIADTKNNRVLRQNTAGGATFSVIADSSKGISKPRDVTVSSTGQVFVTNAGTHQIMKIVALNNELGTVNVVAGTGAAGFSGDGGTAKQARLNLPNPGTAPNDVQLTANIITLSDGSMVFTDSNNNRLRQLNPLQNLAPTLADVANQTVNEGASLTLTFTATDINDDPITFSLTGNPSFGTFTDNGNGSATLQLTPGFNHSGTYNLGITASDSALTSTINFTLTVNDVNRAPVVTANPLNPSYRATSPAGATINLSGSATDPEGDVITYKWFDGQTQIATTANATVTLSVGTHSIFLMATDSKNASSSSAAQAVLVKPMSGPNQPPVAVANQLPANIQATSPAGVSVALNGSGSSDPDEDLLTYSWRDNGTQIATGVTATVMLSVGDHSITLTVTDELNASATTAAQAVKVKLPEDYTIFTLAGNGIYGLCGNNMPANTTCFKEITALGVTPNGQVLIVDGPNRNVRMVTAQGQIVAVAGNSSQGNGGDGKAAALASFGATAGVAADSLGNIYVSDSTYNRVRIVTPDGKIAHFAGDPAGVAGNIGDGGQASNARLRRPTRLTVDAQNNLYISDSGNNRVRCVNALTKVITTVAGNGGAGFNGDGGPATSAAFNNPSGIAVDPQKNIYIADANNHRVRKVDGVTKIITTIAGDGTAGYNGEDLPAVQSSLNLPTGVVVDGASNVYIADQNNHRLRMLTVATGRLSTVTGQGTFGYGGDNGKAKIASIAAPTDVALQNSNARAMFLADNGNRRVRKLDKDVQPNNLPVAVAKPLPSTVNAGQSVALDATDSSDPDGDLLTYSWTDNGVEIATTAVANVTLSIGTHSIILTVNDGHGGVSSTTAQTVTVGGSSVVISSIFPSSCARGDNASITIIGSGFTPQSQISISGVGVTVFTKYVSSTKLTATVMVSSSAFAGYRSLTVKNPGGDSATKTNSFQIK